MSSDQIIDYLTKEVTINNNVVTFRLLSRRFSIHVNAAKNELAVFHAQMRDTPERVHATYLVCGDVSGADGATQSDAMELDPSHDGPDGEEAVVETRVVLVGERALEETKASFGSVRSCHVYSLSPSALRDADLVCPPSEDVHKKDAEKGLEYAAVVGRVASPAVKFRAKTGKGKGKEITKPSAAASSSKIAAPAPAVRAPAAAVASNPKVEEKQKDSAPVKVAPEKPKLRASGALDWSNAKAKGAAAGGKEKAEPAAAKVTEGAKRGTKRKSEVVMRGDADAGTPKPPIPLPKRDPSPPSKPQPREGARVKRGTIVSDDESEEAEPTPKSRANAKGKAKAVVLETEVEKSMREMMDVDDDEVIRVPRTIRNALKQEEEEEAEKKEEEEIPETTQEDVAMDDDLDSDPAPKTKPRKRKEKKVVPVGRNGLKKRRIVKSRMKEDAKGYMVTEDYSSYESVDEEEAEVAATKPNTKKAQKKGKTADIPAEGEPANPQPEPPASSQRKALKPKASGSMKTQSGQGTLMGFFGGGGKSKK